MDKKPLSQRAPKNSVIRIDSDGVGKAPAPTRKKQPLFGIAAAAIAPQLPSGSGTHRGFVARHISRAVLAGEPNTTRNRLTKATRKTRRNRRRAMRNRMGYR